MSCIPVAAVVRRVMEAVQAVVNGAAPRKPKRERKVTLATVAKQASKAAIPVARYEVKPDGTVVVVTGQPDASGTRDKNEWDNIQ